MELKDVVAISGMPGLYHVIGQRKNGLIVEALDGSGKKIPTSATTKVSILSDIAMFTMEGEERLAVVLLSIFDKVKEGLVLPDKKANDDAFPQFLGKVLPNFDNERIYLSDMKKLATWYTILSEKLDFEALRKSIAEADSESEGENKSEVKDTKVKETKAKAEKSTKTATPKGDTKSKGKSVNTIRKMA
ncbi:MAG: DUF5606 domain-containing protein [Bacteroidia bacterium]|nr:DUF5606 domain-containing protein [Bacteroidia bacterium]